jgi:hypothetical protein
VGYKCEKCGHEGADGPFSFSIDGWESCVSPSVAQKLSAVKFDAASGPGFRTLFLTACYRLSMTAMLNDLGLKACKSSPESFFRKRLAPVLDKLDANFEVLGHLALPSRVMLARTELAQPIAIFTFVTVKDQPDLEQKLHYLGLSSLLAEGVVNTVDGSDWYQSIQ